MEWRLTRAHRASAGLEADLAAVRLPFLAMHGTADTVVDISGSRLLHARSASSDKTLEEVPGALHSLLCELPPVREAVLRRVVAWVAERTPSA